jgi:enediyne polyketide synthase
MEIVCGREASAWRDVLGPERFRLAEFLSLQHREELGVAASRIWTAAECLKKAGLSPDAPLVFDRAAEDGWVVLKSGRWSAASYVARIDGSRQPLAISVLLPADDESV